MTKLQIVQERYTVPLELSKLQSQNKREHQYHFDWDLNTRDLASNEPTLQSLDNDQKVYASPTVLCYSNQSNIFIGEDQPLELINVSTGGATNGECNFISSFTEFGTEHCDLSLFEEYI